jgi:TusA-related sulfurtransferase
MPMMNAKTAPLTVDARGLEPPQPLVVILEALARVSEGAELQARTDRRPMHLYPHLEQRGFVGTTEEQTDGSFITTIRRA